MYSTTQHAEVTLVFTLFPTKLVLHWSGRKLHQIALCKALPSVQQVFRILENWALQGRRAKMSIHNLNYTETWYLIDNPSWPTHLLTSEEARWWKQLCVPHRMALFSRERKKTLLPRDNPVCILPWYEDLPGNTKSTSPTAASLPMSSATIQRNLKCIQPNPTSGSWTPPAKFKTLQAARSRLDLVYKSIHKNNLVFLTVQPSVLQAQASPEWHFHQYYLKQRLEFWSLKGYFGNNCVTADAPPPGLHCHLPTIQSIKEKLPFNNI